MDKEWSKKEIEDLAWKLDSRSSGGWRTLLSPETTKLVVKTLRAYVPQPPPQPLPRPPGTQHSVDMFSDGSTIYRLYQGEVIEIAAWAKSTIIARAAFDALERQYPEDVFEQRRRAWVERKQGETS